MIPPDCLLNKSKIDFLYLFKQIPFISATSCYSLPVRLFHLYMQVHKDGLSSTVVAMNSRDQYEIIGVRKISHFITQPCNSVYLKKALEMHQTC